MILHNVVQAIFLLTGAISLLSALLNWEWFFTTDNARFAVKKFGRNGARWIYGTIGLLLMAAAIYFYFQVEKFK
jgi:hypothetical protein